MQLLVLLLIVGAVGLYWKWLAAAVVAWFAGRWIRHAIAESRAAARSAAAERAGLVARADEQHGQVLRGDERGVTAPSRQQSEAHNLVHKTLPPVR
jgi:hypothetical protein